MKFLKSEAFAPRLELFIAIMLGITAVLTAWAAWQSSLYDGNQASSYTAGTAQIADANSLYNEADQLLVQDMDVWNKISELRIEIDYATQSNNTMDMERYQWKLDQIMYDNVSESFYAAIEWADSQEEYASPFEMEGYVENYYVDANAAYDAGYAKIDEGEENNALGDILGLATVIYAVVLFLLGIINTFKNNNTKAIITLVSIAALIFAIIMTVQVPIATLDKILV